MKWIELNGKKDPPFGMEMLILLSGTNSWKHVSLKQKVETPTGKVYIFEKESDPEIEYTTASHYMIPETPKNNQ